MSKLCAVCVLPAKTRDAIDRALINGQTYKNISQRFKRRVSIFALCRHRKHLLPKDLVRQDQLPKPEPPTTLQAQGESPTAQKPGPAGTTSKTRSRNHAARPSGKPHHRIARHCGVRETRPAVDR